MNTIRLNNDREVNTVRMLRTCLDLQRKNLAFHNDVVLSCDISADKLTTEPDNNPSMAVGITLTIRVHMTPDHSAPYP
jgi:hypothetical protein